MMMRISLKQAWFVHQIFSVIFFLLSASSSTKAWLYPAIISLFLLVPNAKTQYYFLAYVHGGAKTSLEIYLNNPNFYPFGQQHFSLKNNSKPSPQFFRFIQRDRQDFAHILPISYPVSNILLNRISKITFSKTKVEPHSRGTFTTQSGP